MTLGTLRVSVTIIQFPVLLRLTISHYALRITHYVLYHVLYFVGYLAYVCYITITYYVLQIKYYALRITYYVNVFCITYHVLRITYAFCRIFCLRRCIASAGRRYSCPHFTRYSHNVPANMSEVWYGRLRLIHEKFRICIYLLYFLSPCDMPWHSVCSFLFKKLFTSLYSFTIVRAHK